VHALDVGPAGRSSSRAAQICACWSPRPRRPASSWGQQICVPLDVRLWALLDCHEKVTKTPRNAQRPLAPTFRQLAKGLDADRVAVWWRASALKVWYSLGMLHGNRAKAGA
jgi:hypothetical protein